MNDASEKQVEKSETQANKVKNEQKGPTFGEKFGKFWFNFRAKLATLIAPKDLDDSEEDEAQVEVFMPETTADLVWLIKKCPENVLSKSDRKKIMTMMTFSDRKARDVMTPRGDITFVHENDFMGPLTLDKLYKSGLSHFPVLNTKGGIAGVLDTDSLNKLEIKDTDRASSFVNPKVFYVRDNYTLPMVLAAFIRTDSSFLIVINSDEQIVGLVNFKDLISQIVGEIPDEDFDQDKDSFAVAKR